MTVINCVMGCEHQMDGTCTKSNVKLSFMHGEAPECKGFEEKKYRYRCSVCHQLMLRDREVFAFDCDYCYGKMELMNG